MEEDTKPEDVFDESSLLPEALSCNSELLGGQSVTVPAEVPVAKPKRLPRKKYRWAENEDVKYIDYCCIVAFTCFIIIHC